MIFHNYKELALEMNLQIEDIEPNIEAILTAWNEFSDPEKIYEIVEGGVMEFDDNQEYQTWQAQQ
jgi:hypothetical protein